MRADKLAQRVHRRHDVEAADAEGAGGARDVVDVHVGDRGGHDLAVLVVDREVQQREVERRHRQSLLQRAASSRSGRDAGASSSRAASRRASARSPRGRPRAGRRAPSARGTSPAACTADTRADRRRTSRRPADSALPSTPGIWRDDGVDHDERRRLAAGEHVVADRELLVDEVAARARRRLRSGRRRARRSSTRGERHRPCDGRARAPRGESRTRCARGATVAIASSASTSGADLHHHAVAAAVRGVVGRAMAVVRVVAEVDERDLEHAGVARALRDARPPAASAKSSGKMREDVDAHGVSVEQARHRAR